MQAINRDWALNGLAVVAGAGRLPPLASRLRARTEASLASVLVDGARGARGVDRDRPPTAPRWSVNVDRIERARVLNAWTRKYLASVAHFDRKTLTDMCSGRRRPALGTLQAICAALRLTIADVIAFETIEPSSSTNDRIYGGISEP